MDKRFEQVYREHSKFVYNVALGMLRNKTEAEDIMQSVFIKLFSNYDAFRGESAIRTYLYRMTVNKCLDLFRLRKIREAKHEQMGLPEQRNTAAANELYSLMEKLDPDLKAPILLSEIGGFSYKEIGEILGINLGTVKSRIHRGMNKL
ncbi:MAG TPA: RNA polymerase sigma factor, partial [Candidatus Goldiibacteriota bacterium]|nr:RNA polymerase sigma factor [Candidatus Goldiibacteriota bacterium]